MRSVGSSSTIAAASSRARPSRSGGRCFSSIAAVAPTSSTSIDFDTSTATTRSSPRSSTARLPAVCGRAQRHADEPEPEPDEHHLDEPPPGRRRRDDLADHGQLAEPDRELAAARAVVEVEQDRRDRDPERQVEHHRMREAHGRAPFGPRPIDRLARRSAVRRFAPLTGASAAACSRAPARARRAGPRWPRTARTAACRASAR